MENNLDQVRQQFAANNNSSNLRKALLSGFQYAVRNDGTSLAEQTWRELHQQGAVGAQRRSRPPNQTPRHFQSLQDIENIIQSAALQYTQNRNQIHQLPRPCPTVQTTNPLPSTPFSDNAPPQQPPQTRAEFSTLQSSTEAISNLQSTSSTSQTLFSSGISPINAPRGFSSAGFQRASTLGNQHHESISVLNAPAADDDNDDEFDALCASIDVDQIVSKNRITGTSQNPMNQSMPPPAPVTMMNTSCSNHNHSTFDLYDTDDEHPPNISNNTTNHSIISISSTSHNGLSSDISADRSIVSVHGSSFSGFQSNMRSNAAALPTENYDSFGNDFNDNRPNQQFVGSKIYDSSSTTTFLSDSFSQATNTFANQTPLCPGHNLPCLILTSRSSNNNGRQFYKCPLDDGQRCDFFQWVDGIEGNWNNGNDAFSGSSSSTETKDPILESRHKFGHRSFRPGQKEVIMNAIAGRDVFVLMPTGGGKSLCYQLPAWCCPGVTVVISPLLSLIQDQVQSMKKLGVESVFLASSQDYETEQVHITRQLNDATPHGGIKLLYLTPEKINNSQLMQNILRRLYNKKLLSRFVVDEAHCLSDWGHDFRPDYNKLGMLRQEFPGVPLMALTATANEKVVNDAIRALGMRNEYRYVSSFNRPNLCYEVRKKDGKTIDEIAEYISNRPKDSGVIYCLSRKDCETLAGKLQEKIESKPGCNRIRVSFYHADLDASERERRHRDWSNGIISVLCATIAFGMGIDKPDVRYVIHYSMPKSITHYYQESGRAGRDREEADCILYYTYKDKRILEHMIIKSSNDPYGQATRRKIDQLYTCVRYCEDAFRCRRTMQLEFFGEHFDKSKCNKTCDNCKAQREPDRRDLTNEAKLIIQLFRDVSRQKRGNGVTLVQLMELFRGSKSQSSTKGINTASLRSYGVGSKYKKHEVDRIFHAMVFDRLLQESSEQNKGGFTSDYVNLGENAAATESGRRHFFVEFPKESAKPPPDKENTKKQTTTSRKKLVTKKASSEPKEPKAVSTSKVGPESMILQIDDSSDDENNDGNMELDVKPASWASRSEAPSVLPQAATKELVSRFKTLATNWAEEERLMGNASFYWNILSNDSMKTIAAQAPMSIDELKALGVVGENIIKEYGERIVRAVQSFVTQQGLGEYINRRPTKRAKVISEDSLSSGTVVSSNPVSIDLVEDEFDDPSIDFASIQLPEPIATVAPKKTKKASPYFT